MPPPPSVAELRAIGIRDDEQWTVGIEDVWWRVHRTTGSHVLGWKSFREYGPVLRFDPHPRPVGDHAGVGVWYGGSDPTVALAEAFQSDRTIGRGRDDPYLTGLRFTRELVLLDITTDSGGAWPTRAGGTFALSTCAHTISQRWARRITQAFPELDGLRYNSRFAGGPSAVLFAPAVAAMPERPVLSLPLANPGLAMRIATASLRLGYAVV